MKNSILLTFCALLIGYTATAQWQHINGPSGIFNPRALNDHGVLYALDREGNVFKTLDKGEHWDALELPFSANKNHIKIIENGNFYGINAGRSVVRSTDQGTTWERIFLDTLPHGANEHLYGLFVKADTLLVCSEFTIYRSVNGGKDWQGSTDLFGYGLTEIFSNGSEYFAWGDRYVFRSSDGGKTWEKVYANAQGLEAVCMIGKKIYGLYSSFDRIIKSDDGLRTWTPIYNDSITKYKPTGCNPLDGFLVGNEQRLYCFYTFGNDNGVEYECDNLMSYSEDGGSTWKWYIDGGFMDIKVTGGIALDDRIVVTHWQGISSIANNSLQFKEAEEGLSKYDGNYGMAVSDYGIFSNSSSAHLYKQAYASESWQQIAVDSTVHLCHQGTSVAASRKWVAFLYGFSYYFSKQAGLTGDWHKIQELDFDFIQSSENALWSRDYKEVQILRDSDSTVTIIPNASLGANNFKSFTAFQNGCIYEEQNGAMYVLDENGSLMFKSPIPPCTPFPQPIQVDFKAFDGENLFFFCGPNAYKFNKNGTSWETIYPVDVATGIPLYHSPIRFIKAYRGVLWIGLANKGLYFSTDGGNKFFPFNPQVPDSRLAKIFFLDDKMWVNTRSGIYTLQLKPAVSTVETELTLYPNPSNGNLQVASTSFLSQPVDFELFDASGRLIHKARLSPGSYWDFDFTGLPCGVYFVRFKTELGASTQKWVIH